MAGWTGKKVSVSFSKPEEPSFLKKFKERVGYKEDHGLSEKFAKMPDATDDDVADKGDELPQVVSLRSGDLTQEEVDRLRSEGKLDDEDLLKGDTEGDDDLLKGDTEGDDDLLAGDTEGEVQGPKERDQVCDLEVPHDGRILFRKPTKRSSDDPAGRDGKKLKEGKDEEDPPESKTKKVKKKGVQNKKLLSFNFDEDEEDEDC